METLAALLSSSRGLIAFALVTSVLSGFGGSLLVALINESLTAPRDGITLLGLKFAGLSVAVLALRWLSETRFITLGQRALAQLRSHMSRRIAGAPYRVLERRGPARFLAVLTEDVATVAQFFVSLPELLMNGAVVIGCLIYLGVLSLPVFGFALVMVLLGSLAYHFADLRAISHVRAARAGEDDLQRHFRALLDGAKELRLHEGRRQAFLTQCLDQTIEHVRARRSRGLTISIGAASTGSFLFFVVIGVVLFVLARFVDTPAPVMSGYALMFLYMILPLEALLGSLPVMFRARVALEQISELSAELGVQHEPPSTSATSTATSVRLRGVTHSYVRDAEDGVFTLGPIDLDLRRGELVFLIGGNGSGKTTLAKLLVGLYTPDAGEVWLDGERIDDASLARYRQSFSVVWNDFFLFDRLLGLSQIDLDARATRLLQELHLDRKVNVRDGVFSTTELSQGQRKRLALVVAYLEDRPFYVFDEWAADQDPTYKEVFYRRLLPELKARGKAVLAITHDDRYFDLADRRVKLDMGQVVGRRSSEAPPLLEVTV